MHRFLIRIVISVGLVAALLFGSARTFHWPRAWILLGVLLVGRVWGIVSLYRVHPDLVRERMRSPLASDQSGPDKVLLPAFMLTYAFLAIFVALDATRWHLLPAPPISLAAIGLVAYAVGLWGIVHVMLANRFASRVVRIQEERGHSLVESGPYRWVRHPMYAYLIPMIAGFALWLGSSAGVLLATIPIGILALRSVFEERLLRERLPGYREYMQRVRWRMIPYIW